MTETPLSDEQIDAIAHDGYYIDATGEPQSLFAVGRMVVKSLCAQAKAYTALRAQLATAGAEIKELEHALVQQKGVIP